MREERRIVGGVPTRVFAPGGAHGLLLVGHGGGQSKDGERFVGLCRSYAEQTGLTVVCIDAVDHGERRPAHATERLPSGWHSRAIPTMAGDWQRVVGHLSSFGPAVAYVGFSMGAIFGFATVATIPTIIAAVFVAAGVPNAAWIDDDNLGPALVRAAGSLGGANVLMLNKDNDELFDSEAVRRLFHAVAARSKKLMFFPGGHDDWGPDLIDASITFVNKHLPSATTQRHPPSPRPPEPHLGRPSG